MNSSKTRKCLTVPILTISTIVSLGMLAPGARSVSIGAHREPRNSVEPVRRWRYLYRVMCVARRLETLVYQLTELHSMRYTCDINDELEW
jgi:hypothetical protein